MKQITVLGAGMVGSAIAKDLANKYQVIVCDIDREKLDSIKGNNLLTSKADISDRQVLQGLIKNADLVIGAVPGYMGFETLKTVISEGKNVVDISFFSEYPFKLDELANEKNVSAVIDCGVAPGMSNIILGHYYSQMEVESYKCYVGGLPFARTLPFQYKAPFSPADVIEEYTRPARLIESGKLVIKEALSEPEYVEVEGVGTLEAFNTDGLRTLTDTVRVSEMAEKTLRYPGHLEAIRMLKDAGFFGSSPVEIKGCSIRPVDFTSSILFPHWKAGDDKREFTVMKIIIKGGSREITSYLFDEYDPVTNISSMARTTGYTCCAAAELILNGTIKLKGIIPPEIIGQDKTAYETILKYLEERNVRYKFSSRDTEVNI